VLQRFKEKRVKKDKEYVTRTPEFVFTGMRRNDSPIKLQETDLWYSKNVFIKDGRWRKRPGLLIFGNGLPLPDPVIQIEQFFKYDGTEYLIAFTTKNIYRYNVNNGYWDLITENLSIDDCESNWTGTSSITPSTDTTWKREGSKSIKLSVASTIYLLAEDADFLVTESGDSLIEEGILTSAGERAYHDFAPIDLHLYTHIHFYIKSSIDQAAGDLQILLDDTSGCVTPIEAIDIPALKAGIATEVNIPLADAASDTAIISVGLYIVNDNGTCDINIDDIRAVNCLTGTTLDRFSCETMYDNDSGDVKFFATNGIDNIKFWNGSGNWADLAGSPNKCKFLKVFYTWLLLLNCTVGGNNIPQRIDWCVPGNPKDWTGEGSGTNTLAMGTGPILGDENIRGQLAILLERSITMMYATGSIPPFFFDENKILDVGCMTPGSIQSLGETILFLGWDNFYIFDGFSCTPVGDEVINFLLDNINPSKTDVIFSHMIEQYNLYLLFFPSVSSDTPDNVLIYDYSKNKFLGVWNFYTNMTSEGYYHAGSAGTIGSLTMTIGEMIWKIGSNILQSIVAYDLFGDNDGYIYKLTEQILNDNGVAIESYMDTKSFMPNIGMYSRFVRLEYYAIGSKLESYISEDNGINFALQSITTLDSAEIEPVLTDPFDVTNEKAMFRLRNAELTGWFDLAGFRYYYIEKTEEV
jgi:hypothetical protein